MLESILLEVIDPRTQVGRSCDYSNPFSIGNRKPADIIIDGEFVGIKHGQFDYYREHGWMYFDWQGVYKPTAIIRGGSDIIHYDGKMMPIITGDELILNGLVHIRVLRALDHSGKQIVATHPL